MRDGIRGGQSASPVRCAISNSHRHLSRRRGAGSRPAGHCANQLTDADAPADPGQERFHRPASGSRARGHHLTICNRGRQNAAWPAPVAALLGDRNGDMKTLESHAWDVCIDNPATLPV